MKKVKYGAFLDRMEDKARRKRLPFRAVFEVTYKCNHECVHCYVREDKSKKEMTTKEVFYVLDELAANGCFLLGLSGGEPFLRDDFLDILAYAHRKCFSIVLLTNGSLIDEKTVKFLKNISLRKIDITILGGTEQTFDSITGVKRSFRRVMHGLDLLTKEGLTVALKCIMLKENLHEFSQMQKIINKYGKRAMRFDYTIHAALNGDKKPLNHRIKAEEGEELWARIGMEDTDYGKNADRFFDCSAGSHSCGIDPYGYISACPTLPYPKYSILEKGLKYGWDKACEFIDTYKPGKEYECPQCDLKDYCNACPAYSYLATGNLDLCPPFQKEKALVRLKRQRAQGKKP